MNWRTGEPNLIFISIPKWSDFSMTPCTSTYDGSIFQSQNGLILVLLLIPHNKTPKTISIPKWSDFSQWRGSSSTKSNSISIPKWSDFSKDCGCKLEVFINISIPKWSDFS